VDKEALVLEMNDEKFPKIGQGENYSKMSAS
jgi:hypothetical protein